MGKDNGRISLESLSGKVVETTIYSPTGEEIKVRLRPLRSYELREIMEGLVEPEPPVGDMQRNPTTGAIEKVPNYQDPTYLKDVAEYQDRRGYVMLLRSLENVDIPGETEDEQVAAMRVALSLWASQQLLDHLNRINGFGQRELRDAQARLTPFAVGS